VTCAAEFTTTIAGDATGPGSAAAAAAAEAVTNNVQTYCTNTINQSINQSELFKVA